MYIVDKRTKSNTKLHKDICVYCNKVFYAYKNNRKCCSMKCKHLLNGLQKLKGEYRNCIVCNKRFWVRPSEDKNGHIRKYCSRKCFRPVERGKAISIDGYYVINCKKVHRIIMEESLGRKLKSSEIVHHINENKLDNRLENLMIVTRSEHNKIHKFLHKKSTLFKVLI